MHISSERMQSSPSSQESLKPLDPASRYARVKHVFDPLQALSLLLLEFDPTSAFTLSGPRTRLAANRNVGRSTGGHFSLWSSSLNGLKHGRQHFPMMSEEGAAPKVLAAVPSDSVTVSLAPGQESIHEAFAPTFEDTSALGAVAVPLPMGAVFEESSAIPGKFEVVEVNAGSAAAAAGLKKGDLMRATSVLSEGAQVSLFIADGKPFDALLEAILSNSEAQGGPGHVTLVIERNTAIKGNLVVCTKGMTCKRAKPFSSAGTFALLRALAATHTGIEKMNAAVAADVPAVELQESFAESIVEEAGCLNACGSGPNVADTSTGEIHRGVYKPSTALDLLRNLGLDIPRAAGEAYLRRMKADQAVEDGKLDEALKLLTEGIKFSLQLRVGGAAMLRNLYAARADVKEQKGDTDGAEADRASAERRMELFYAKK